MNSLWLFAGLQVADLVSTIIFLSLGVHEANPFVKFFVHLTNPITGLLLVKLISIGLGVFCYKTHRRLIGINAFFVCVIVWNAIAIYIA